MHVKYAEIVIVRNLEEESWFNYCKRLLGNENVVYDNDTIIIIFEDETITDTKREYVDKQFVMGPKVFNRVYPTYFKKKDETSLFYKKPSNENGIPTLNFNSIFKDCSKYLALTKVASEYNAIYTSVYDINMFAIVKNNSNEKSPRYLMAYDDNYFERNDIIYLVDRIFKNAF
jgi:hypothetical protein